MAQYGTFKYGSGILYGGSVPSVQLFKASLDSPDRGATARHIKVTLKYTNNQEKWQIDTVRLFFSRKNFVLPKWMIRVERPIRRTKVTLKYNASEMWRVDSIRLKQRIKNRRPQR